MPKNKKKISAKQSTMVVLNKVVKTIEKIIVCLCFHVKIMCQINFHRSL
jgi:hypothetical protein